MAGTERFQPMGERRTTAAEGLVARPARVEEAELLIAFQEAMAAETEGLALDPAALRAGVRAVFEDPGKGEYWVAAERGAVLGCLLLTPEWSDWRNGRVLWIQSVYVVPAARGRGIFRFLYETIRRRVEDDPGLKGLRLYVERRNRGAQRAYEAVGMSQEHYVLYEWLR